jgi:hypothetical protein
MSDAYFVTCKDAGKTAYLLGPFTTEKACKVFAEFQEDNPDGRLSDVIKACTDIDKKAHFFRYGMCKISDYEIWLTPGILNRIDKEKWDKVLS